MKNKMKYISSVPVLLMLLLASCFEDKGNYDYLKISDAAVNIPEVSANKGQISRDRYADLQLTPEITFNAGASAAEYDFEWSIYPQKPQTNADDKYDPKQVIGTSQNLSYHLVQAPGDYYMVLRVNHKEDKAVTDYRFKLSVNSVKGWLIYDENATGEGDLQIIRDREIVPGLSAGQHGVVRDYFSTSNGGKKLAGGKFLYWRNMNNSYDHLFLYKQDGLVKMNAGSYEVITEDYSSMFFTQPAVKAPMAQYYPSPSYGRVEIFINNNEAHVLRWNTMGQVDKFAAPLNAFGTPYKFNPFIAAVPFASSNTVSAVLYNDITSAKGQFVTINTSGNAGYPATATGVFNTAQINPDATTKLRLKYMAQGRDGITCAIFRDELNGNKPWLYVADLRVVAAPLAVGKHDLSGLENIGQAKYFAFGNRGDVMFYATDHDVYSYVFGGSTTNLLAGLEGNVVAMKLYTHSANENYTGRILFVATYDGNAGKVYKIKFNELNGQLEDKVEEFSGFGKVIDMIEKE